MSDYNDFLSMSPVNYSMGQTAAYGYVLWQWDGNQWIKSIDFTRDGGKQQPPAEEGRFCGQLKAVVCEPPDSSDSASTSEPE